MYKDSKGNKVDIDLHTAPLGEGGEGTVYLVKGKWSTYVAKIFLSREIAQEKEQKIRYMVAHSPLKNAPDYLKKTFVWPEEMIFKGGAFAGFLMKKLEGAIELSHLGGPKTKTKFIGAKWSKFDREAPNAFHYRLIICRNLAKSLEILHSEGSYVYIDLKPQNVMVHFNGHVSIVDIDSVQISQQGKILFETLACTADFCPPEMFSATEEAELHGRPIAANWDYFSFAVTAYKILIGCHPFQGIKGVVNDSPFEMICKACFAFGSTVNGKVDHRFHGRYKELPKALHSTFTQTLDIGLNRPDERPNFTRWESSLKQAWRAMYPKPKLFLQAQPASVTAGQSVTISWRVQGSATAFLTGLGAVSASGTKAFKINREHTFVLKAPWLDKEVEKRLRVETLVQPKLSINSDENEILAGKPALVRWKVEKLRDVTAATLNGKPVPYIGNIQTQPSTNGAVVLKVKWKGGVETKELRFKIAKPPSVAFETTDKRILQGNTATLKWNVAHATQVQLSAKGKVTPTGEIKVKLFKDSTFELKAFWLGGSITKKIAIKVDIPPAMQFEAQPEKVYLGGRTTLRWSVESVATSVEVSGLGQVSHVGTKMLRPGKTCQFVLKVKHDSITYQKRVEIEVLRQRNPQLKNRGYKRDRN